MNFSWNRDRALVPVVPAFVALNVPSCFVSITGGCSIRRCRLRLLRRCAVRWARRFWQVSGRSDTDYARRVALDTYYVLNWSPWMDVWVLVRTASAVLLMRGAR